MFYRENGQFKTTYRRTSRSFRFRRTLGDSGHRRLRLRRRAVAGRRVPVPRHPDSLPDPVAGRAGREYPGRLLRPDHARRRRLHGGGRLCRLQLPDPRRWHAGAGGDPARRRSSAVVGIVFGIPSLRVRGLYLAVATLAAQFFWDWAFLRIKWFTNDASSGSVSVSDIDVFGWTIDIAGRQVPVLPRPCWSCSP